MSNNQNKAKKHIPNKNNILIIFTYSNPHYSQQLSQDSYYPTAITTNNNSKYKHSAFSYFIVVLVIFANCKLT